MKTNAIVRIILFSLAITVLLATLSVALLADGLFVNGSTGMIETEVGEVDPAQVKRIEIQWVSGSIAIQQWDGDQIMFSDGAGVAQADKMVWSLSGDTLQIQFCKPRLFGSTPAKNLMVNVPKDWICEELEIDSVSARIAITDIPVQELDLDNVSGRCELQNITGDSVHVSTVSGSVDYLGTAYLLEMETVSADCTLTLSSNARNIQLDSVSGDFTLYLPEEPGFIATMNSLSGRLSSEYESTSQNGSLIWGYGSCRIHTDSVSGSVYLKKQPSVAEVS